MNIAEMKEIGMSRTQYQSVLAIKANEIKVRQGFNTKTSYELAKDSFEVRLKAARRIKKEHDSDRTELLKSLVKTGFARVVKYDSGKYYPRTRYYNDFLFRIGCHEHERWVGIENGEKIEYTIWSA